MKKIIHILKTILDDNKLNNKTRPPILVLVEDKEYVVKHLLIDGPSEIIYKPTNPLPTNATLWIETNSKLILDKKIVIE